ncbi:MAG: tetratricopeptide repeat protein [Elusimicrobiota bacterium]
METPKDAPRDREVVAFAVSVGLAPFVIDYRLFWGGLEDACYLPQSAFIQSLAAALVCVACWRAIRSGGLRSLKTGFSLPLLAFLGWCGLSIVWAHNRYEGLETWLHWAACAAVCFYAARTLRGVRDIRFVLRAFLWSGFAVSVLGILQYLDAPWVNRIPQSLPPASTFGHRNIAVHFVALTLPLAAFAWLTSDHRRSFWMYSLAFWTACLYLFWTSSRAAVLVVGVQAIVAGALLWARPRPFPKGARLSRAKIVAGIAGAVLFAALVGTRGSNVNPERDGTVRRLSATWAALSEGPARRPFHDSPQEHIATGSIRLRFAIWRNILEMARDSPLRGVGLGNAKVHYPDYSRRGVVNWGYGEKKFLSHVHNDYLQVLAETGAVGLVLLLWLGWSVFASFWRIFRKESDPWAQSCLLAIGVSTAGLLANAMVSFPFNRAVPPLVFASYLGILGALSPPLQGSVWLRLSGWKAAVVSVMVFCLTAGLLTWQSRRILAEYCFSRIAGFSATQQWRMVAVAGLAAYRYNPFRKKVLFPVGSAHLRMGDPEKAVPMYEAVLSAYPHHLNTLLNLAFACMQMGRYEDALKYYKEVLRIKPENARAIHGVGELLMRVGQLEKAVPLLRTAARLSPDSALYHLSLGEAAFRNGDLRTARTAFTEALRLKPEYAKAVESLGVKIKP